MRDQINRLFTLRQRLFATPWREMLTAAGPAVLLLGLCLYAAYYFVDPAPPRSLTMSVGRDDESYRVIAERYKEILARDGIELRIEMTAGSVEDMARLRDENSGVDVALLQDGLHEGDDNGGLLSLGSINYEPIWLFCRCKKKVPDRVKPLEGGRIGVGEIGSGLERFAQRLLKENGVDLSKTTLVHVSASQAADQLLADELDSVILFGGIRSPAVQRLLRSGQSHLISLDQAEAYSRRFAFLHHLVLPAGAADFGRSLPAQDVQLIATTTTVVIREGLHPALVSLLLKAMNRVHARPSLFNQKREFPGDKDVDFPLSPDAERFYKSGPPFLQRYLPFWLASLVDRLLVVVLPLLAALIPLSKSIPLLYRWRVKNKILRWYGELKLLEINLRTHTGSQNYDESLQRIDWIEDNVSQARIPLGFSEEFYVLKEHIDLVRRHVQRLKDRGPAAEPPPQADASAIESSA